MYMVWVYDKRKNLIGKFTKPSYNEAMTYLVTNYASSPYEIRKVV